MKRLDAAKKKFQATKDRLTKECNTQDRLEAANTTAEGEYKESTSMLTEVNKEIHLLKNKLFKSSQELFKLRGK